jgi:hypothetical protein
MKNLFNNISREEKNRIIEMHSGKKKVIFEQQTSNCVTTNEIVNLLTSFKFKVVDQNSAQIILERGPSPKMAHNIKNYIITIMTQNHTIKFDKITQSEINSPIPKEPFNFVKKICDFKTINEFKNFVIDKFLDL